jgi:hypothetical protein
LIALGVAAVLLITFLLCESPEEKRKRRRSGRMDALWSPSVLDHKRTMYSRADLDHDDKQKRRCSPRLGE